MTHDIICHIDRVYSPDVFLNETNGATISAFAVFDLANNSQRNETPSIPRQKNTRCYTLIVPCISGIAVVCSTRNIALKYKVPQWFNIEIYIDFVCLEDIWVYI